MNKQNKKRCDELAINRSKETHPNLPDHARIGWRWKDNSTNGLTACVVNFINYSGYQAERVSNTGRYVDDSKIVTDVAGFKRKIGSGKYIPGSGTKGTADIHAVIHGRAVKIEIKFGRDRQSAVQKQYQKTVEEAGGYYWIIRTFDQFIEVYDNFIASL